MSYITVDNNRTEVQLEYSDIN